MTHLQVRLRRLEIFGPARGKLHVVAFLRETMRDGEAHVGRPAEDENGTFAHSPSLSDCNDENV